MFDPQVVAAIIGAGTVLTAQALWRLWTRPKLVVDFNGGDPGYFAHSEVVHDANGLAVVAGARYLRVRVTNRGPSIAKACRAYLVRVEKRDDTQLWRQTIFCDSLRLKWSAQAVGEELRPIDLPKGVDQFVDLLWTMSFSNDYEMGVDVRLHRYRSLFKEHGTFRYTIMIAGDGVAPVRVRVAFQWTGDWEQCRAWEA